MKLAIAAFGAATLVGVGYIIGKKLAEKRRHEQDFFDGEFDDGGDFDYGDDFDNFDNENQSGVYAKGRAKKDYNDKIRKASLFAVGAIKTGADKLGETIQDIKSQDMVKKGEQTFEAVRETGGNIKNDIKSDIEDFKSMVSNSIDEDSVVQATEDLFDDVQDTVGDAVSDVKDTFGTANQ